MKMLLKIPLSLVLTQQRGFKTQQSIERESLRQTTVADRLRDGLKSRQRSSRNIQQEAESNAKLKGRFSLYYCYYVGNAIVIFS